MFQGCYGVDPNALHATSHNVEKRWLYMSSLPGGLYRFVRGKQASMNQLICQDSRTEILKCNSFSQTYIDGEDMVVCATIHIFYADVF